MAQRHQMMTEHMAMTQMMMAAAAAVAPTVYTCPMHPDIRQDQPGDCPKCGMTLEPVLPSLIDAANPELVDFTRRFWWTLPLTVVVTVLAMFGHQLGWTAMATQSWCPKFCCSCVHFHHEWSRRVWRVGH